MTITAADLAANLDDPVWRVGYIYTITNTVTSKVYVGSSVNTKRRFYLHRRDLVAGKHHSPIFQNAWNKYGSEAFAFEVVETVPDVIFLVVREQFWMWRNDGRLMNCCAIAGSPIGIKRTAGQRKAASDAKRAYYATPEGRAKLDAMHAKNLGRKQGDEERAMRSERLTGNKSMGRKWTDEQRAAHSIALKGRKMPAFSEQWKANISAGKRRANESKR